MNLTDNLAQQELEQISTNSMEVTVRFLIYIGKDIAPVESKISCSQDATVRELIDRLAEVYGQKLKEIIMNQRFHTVVDGISFSYRGLDEKLNTEGKTSIGVVFLPVFDQGG